MIRRRSTERHQPRHQKRRERYQARQRNHDPNATPDAVPQWDLDAIKAVLAEQEFNRMYPQHNDGDESS